MTPPAAADGAQLATDEERKAEKLDPATAAMIFQTGESRRYAIDQMMWQVPALTLTAQAFLLTIAFGSQTSWIARVVAACVGLVTAGAGIQLLLRHRYHEFLTSNWLERLAAAHDWPILHHPDRAEAFAFHGDGHPARKDPWPRGRLAVAHSPGIWIKALLVFATADCVVLLGWLVHAADHSINWF